VPSLSESELAARREEVRRRRRRRALVEAAAIIAVGVAAAAGVAIAASGGGGGSGGNPTARVAQAPAPRAPGPQTPAPQSRAKRAPSSPFAAIDAAGRAQIARLAQYGLPVYCGGPHGNEVAFTFDDGPGVYTHFAVKKLTQAGERATFFVVGKSMDAWPGWLPKELKVAAIADHTYHHPLLTPLSPEEIRSELQLTKRKIERDSAQPVDLFRPPYGGRNATVDGIAKSLGMLEIMWTMDSRDSLGADWNGIIQNVEAGLRPGSIVLMHENRGQTIRALTTLLPELKRRHLRSVSLPELFATDPPSVSQLRRGPGGCGVKSLGNGS
jgi:peptidoglycan/xylan/chitin deacetylase (PgdA/CDA1 family)